MGERAKAWKQTIYKDVKFPSGNEADLKRVSAVSMITEEGIIPDAMYDVMFSGDGQQQDMAVVNQKLKEAGIGMRDYIKSTLFLSKQAAREAFVSPKVVDSPDYDNDEISIDDIGEEDLMFLWEWMMGGGEPGEALKRFLAQQQRGSVSSVSQMPSVLPVSGKGNGDN